MSSGASGFTFRIPSRPAQACRVVLGHALAPKLLAYLRGLRPRIPSLLIVTEPPVARPAASFVAALESAKDLNPRVLMLPGGERSKSLGALQKLYDEAFVSPLPGRDAVVLAVGGGSTGDAAGFFAASCLRGLRCIQVPTTLLAMVDSSLGGKTALNHARGKNLIGAFHQPLAIFADLDRLDTLPRRHYVAALAEAVKLGVVLDAKFFRDIERNAESLLAREPTSVQRLVLACLKLKARVVAQDPYEDGPRKLLNFGHTVGHAFEHAARGKLLHGEAVALGMLAAARLGAALGHTPALTLERIDALLAALGLPLARPRGITDSALLAAMQADKKRSADGLTFVIPGRIGSAKLVAAGDPARALRLALMALRPAGRTTGSAGSV